MRCVNLAEEVALEFSLDFEAQDGVIAGTP